MPTRGSHSYARCIARFLFVVSALVPCVAPAQARGTPAPEIDLPSIAGRRVKLSSFKGQPVVVTFWGTWCPPCREEFPELVAAQKKYRDARLQIIAVNQRDQELSDKAVRDFAAEFGVEFPIVLDARGRTRRTFRLIGLPTTIFIDRDGIVQLVHSGPISRAELGKALTTIVPPKTASDSAGGG
jgi:thiol-disulfide isomerase/thioredoxin